MGDKKNNQNIPLGASRFGGEPDLPPELTWPSDKLFFAQINFSEVTRFDRENILPKQGILYLFADDCIEESTAIFVANPKNLVRTAYPESVELESYMAEILEARALKFKPNFYFSFINTISSSMGFTAVFKAFSSDFLDNISEVLGGKNFKAVSSYYGSRFFGDEASESAMEGEFEEEDEDEEWDGIVRMFLFQFDYEDGGLFISVPPEDLKKGDLGRCEMRYSGT